MYFLKSFINIGVIESMPYTLKSRIRATNIFILIIMFVLTYLVFVFSQLRGTSTLTFLGFIVLSACLPLLNYIGLHQVVRLIISFIPCLAVLFYDISAKLSNATLGKDIELISYISPHFVVVVSVTVPLALFLYRERFLLILSSTIILLVSIFFNNIYSFFGVSPQDLGLYAKTYGFVQINVYICLVIILATYVFQVYNSFVNEKNNALTLKETKEKNKQLRENEKKLKLNFLELEENRVETNQQEWFNEGLAKFSEILQSSHQNKDGFQKVISELIKYLNASQGGIYAVRNASQNEESYIELIAFYAFNYQKYKKQVFFMGEGLVGQVALSMKTIHLSELDESYTRIESGLGEALPTNLLIVPLVFNEEVHGILELSSFEIFKPFQIEFLEKLGENIAASLYNQAIQRRTENLLRESQDKNKMIKVKEEEYKRKEVNYLGQIENLEKAVLILKKQLKNKT